MRSFNDLVFQKHEAVSGDGKAALMKFDHHNYALSVVGGGGRFKDIIVGLFGNGPKYLMGDGETDFELGLLKKDKDGEYDLCRYEDPFDIGFDDGVIGYQTIDQVNEAIKKMEEYKAQ